MIASPTVSVVITVYNAEQFIERTIRSVMNQTVRDIEIICVNDCSRDNSRNIILDLMKEDDRIILIDNEENMKVSKTRNRGIERARAPFVALLDSDDEWKSTYLETMLMRQRETGAQVIYCSYDFMTNDGTVLPASFIVKESVTYKQLFRQNIIAPSASLVSRDLYLKYPFYADKVHEDYVCFLSILREIGVAYGVPEPLVIYRLTDGSKSRNKLKSILMTYRTYKTHGVSFFKRCFYTLCNALNGIKKYKKVSALNKKYLKEKRKIS